MTSAERQSQIKAALGANESPVTATTFAQTFGVSRQTVVGDIALLRAQGETIIATPQGYQYEQPVRHQAVIVCKHSPLQTEQELTLIIRAGGSVLDVIVDHPLYGQLRGELQIKTMADVKLFMGQMRAHDGRLLSELTDGVHLHTVAFDQPEQLVLIKDALRQAGILFETL